MKGKRLCNFSSSKFKALWFENSKLDTNGNCPDYFHITDHDNFGINGFSLLSIIQI